MTESSGDDGGTQLDAPTLLAATIGIRSQYKMELAKGLTLMNGGGAVALLAFLQATWRFDDNELIAVMTNALLWALAFMSLGVGLAVAVHGLNDAISMRMEGGRPFHHHYLARNACWFLSAAFFYVAIFAVGLGASRSLSILAAS